MGIKNIAVVIILLLAGHMTYAQSKVTGKIIDTENLAIPGANIILTSKSNKQIGTTSDLEGKFTLQVNESGTYSMKVTFVGYETYTKELSITANSEQDLGTITLSLSNELLQSVEIIGRKRTDYNSDYSFSATKIAIKNKELPQSVSTVTKN